MARKKGDCDECCSFAIIFTPDNCLTVKQKQASSLSKGKGISFENAINKILSEYRNLKETGVIK